MFSWGAEAPRSRDCFDYGWLFHQGDAPGAEKPDYDASDWRELDLPHDFSVEGPFRADAKVGAPGGYLPMGIGWYRKTFRMPEGSEGKMVFVEFDGAYMNSEVWINGHHLGRRPYGYIGFEYELTRHLDFSGDNVIAVKVDNEMVPSGRWYAGTGIYRHVWLKTTNPLRVAHWGTYVTTPKITEEKATIEIETTIINGLKADQVVEVGQMILSRDGENVAETKRKVLLKAPGLQAVKQQLELANLKLWSPVEPNLYQVFTTLRIDGKLHDVYQSPLGVRTIEFTLDKGLLVNGVSTLMKGMCNHQDLGPLGTALWDQALERRMKMLKEMGCNAIRTAHYPHSPELMHLCDRMGFLVLDETFDEWRRGWAFEGGTLVASKSNKGKAKFGYNKYFDEWHKKDLVDHIKRDRNHPCVIMWSVGNEVPESVKYGETETVQILGRICKETDPTRPFTVGCNHMKSANESGFTNFLDIVGYNEGVDSVFEIEGDLTEHPKRLLYLSELPHSLQTRGEYRTHPRYYREGFNHPKLTEEEAFPETDAYYESSYDNSGVQTDARRSWRITSNEPRVMGEFRWTGFDYIGESGGWPRMLGNFGIIDLCNFPKDHYFFYQSRWAEKPMVHILPHWTLPGKDGVEIPVWCYTNCEEAELFLNGKSLGTKTFTKEHDMHLEWMVPYAPGELKVVGRNGGKEVASMTHVTAGAPMQFVVEADQMQLDPARRDLSFLTIRMQDEDGNFVPTADRWVSVRIEGPARLIGSGSGDPLSHTSFQANTFRTFNGLGRAIIAAKPGLDEIRKGSKRELNEVIVRVYSKKMEAVELRLKRTGEGISSTGTGDAVRDGGVEIGVDGLPVDK